VGGVSGVGVTTGRELVYLVFWGSQWGTEGTNTQGYKTFSGDPQGVAPDLQAFFTGLGSSVDKWSGVMTQSKKNEEMRLGENQTFEEYCLELREDPRCDYDEGDDGDVITFRHAT